VKQVGFINLDLRINAEKVNAMPKSHQCSFCGETIPPGTGIMYVKIDGSTLWFCSSKCRKNAIELKRDARKLKWTKYYQKEERARI